MDGSGDELLVSRGQALIAISVTSTVLAIGTCGVRFMARKQANRGVWWDDYSVIVAMVMGFVAMIFASVEATSISDPIRAMQFYYLAKPWLMFGTTLGKISICFFFLRTLGRRRPWNVFLGMLILLLALVNLAFALGSNLLCRPLEKLWNQSVEGECFDGNAELGTAYFQGGFAVFAFLFLCIFPVMVAQDLVLIKSIRWPFYLLAISMMLAGIFSIIRTYQISVIGARGSFSGDVLLATIFDVLTQNLAITAANVIPLGTMLSAPNGRDLSNLVSVSSNRLEDLSHRSSGLHTPPHSAKSTIFIIEGPRSGDADDYYYNAAPPPPPPVHHRHDLESGLAPQSIIRPGTAASNRGATSRPGTATGHRSKSRASMSRPGTAASWISATGSIGRSGTLISAGGPPPPGVNTEALQGVIMKTVSVEVVEETVDDAEGLRGADWRDILKGSH
ncbi:hypothetical protein jhhlp_002174 [Lomentospora prolificans]|uniref:Rhodopsin domain-containing protein n=1 Tax=Lomentospora prolificans TaxID=41688 RepID=A0A2N3NDC7_9PEZI|nr:hypothetical protein jhhlp_002174 [Lomentospora prolificans]